MKWLSIVMLICGLSFSVFGQKLTIDIEGYPLFTQEYGKSFVVPYSGIGISYFNNKYAANLKYRSISWGSEISIGQGIKFPIKESKIIDLESLSQISLGIPLFYNKFSTSFGISSRVNFKFNNFRRIYLSLGMGYHINPSYRKVSRKYQYFEGLIGIHTMLVK